MQIGFKQSKPYDPVVSLVTSSTKFIHVNSEDYERLFSFLHSRIDVEQANEGIFLLSSTKHIKFALGKGEKTIKSIEIIDIENFVSMKFDQKAFEKLKQLSFYLHQLMGSMMTNQQLVATFVERKVSSNVDGTSINKN